jgi:hypothetical protein
MHGGLLSLQKLLVIFVVVVVLLMAFLGVVYTQPVSKIRVRAYVGLDYGAVQVTVYVDDELKGNKDVSWNAGPFDETYNVVPGKHTVHADWSKYVDGMTNETVRVLIGPISTHDVYFFHGVGLV